MSNTMCVVPFPHAITDICTHLYFILHQRQDVCGRYKGMEFVPTCIECFYRKQSYHYSDSNTAAPFHNLDLPIPHIAIGDTEGGVTIIKLHAEFGLSTEVGMKKKNQILFSQAVEVG